jgi:hypothetical protein
MPFIISKLINYLMFLFLFLFLSNIQTYDESHYQLRSIQKLRFKPCC